MKNLSLFFFLAFLTNSVLAQKVDDKYTANFRRALVNLDSSWADPVRMKKTAGQFEILANYKKEDWLPRYYHALCLLQMSWMSAETEREGLIKAAETSIKMASDLSPNNSEIVALEGWMYQATVVLNPMVNGMIYGPKSTKTLQKAEELDPTNPRPHYLEGSFIYFTPEMWGGGMDRAKPHLEKAKELFANFKPASDFAPNWGNVPNQMILDGKMPKE